MKITPELYHKLLDVALERHKESLTGAYPGTVAKELEFIETTIVNLTPDLIEAISVRCE